MKRPGLQNKRVGVLRVAYRAKRVFGTSEKLAPGPNSSNPDKRNPDFAETSLENPLTNTGFNQT